MSLRMILRPVFRTVARIAASLEVRLSRVAVGLRSIFWRSRLEAQGALIGPGLRVRAGARFHFSRTSRVSLGRELLVGEDAQIFIGPEGSLEVGDHVFIGRHCTVVANERVRIASHTQIAHGVTIIDSDHRFGDPSRPLIEQGQKTAPIELGESIWIGSHAVILKGVKIGGTSVVGAGAIVTKSFGPGSVLGGNPAQNLRSRSCEKTE